MSHIARMRFLKAMIALGLFLGATVSAKAQGQTLPPNTVLGRTGITAGPAQAIPFATLLANLQGLPNVITGPGTTVIGNIVEWNSTTGTAVTDSGVALNGTGSITLGTGGSLSIASGKTLTDTSANAGVLLLGAGGAGGGFTSYAGATCTNTAITVFSAAGAATCLANKAATNKTIANPSGPNSTSVFTMQGLAGTITPAVTGTVMITISGVMFGHLLTSSGNGIQLQISFGTGAAPGSNAAITGTQVGSLQIYTIPATATAGNTQLPFSMTAVVTGLTLGTAYWIDLAANAVANTGFSLVNVDIAAVEI